jgi:small GTP-binding protein
MVWFHIRLFIQLRTSTTSCTGSLCDRRVQKKSNESNPCTTFCTVFTSNVRTIGNYLVTNHNQSLTSTDLSQLCVSSNKRDEERLDGGGFVFCAVVYCLASFDHNLFLFVLVLLASRMTSIFLAPEQTRLVTICAHVDHGKTTLADNLIESNGIISERLAGTLRYLDSLEEEQRRGITMKASAIGLKHKVPGTKTTSETEIIVHLLDSPGHTDFSTEVSSSLQCCDGTLLVVDAVEGMCARTHQVLREAYSHQLVPILVINKVDRLCTDLCLSPTEAYLRLRVLIESVNAASGAMLNAANIDDEHENR